MVSSAPISQIPESAAALRSLDGIVHLLTCGSVDDGKSTLIGRMLWDAADLPEDTRANLLKSAGPDGEPDLSLVVDGLVSEREQGITIDIAWRYFDTDRRRFVIIDSPGHEQYTRNMASGASHADVAIMLVDARHGVKRQTRRHAAILDLVGVRHVVLAVNKMDIADWSRERFEEIERDFRQVTARLGFVDAIAMPISARAGDNVVNRSRNMPWYQGPTLIEHIGRIPSRRARSDAALRFPVQMVLRDGQDFRGLAGTVSSGAITVGSTVHDTASGREAKVQRIVTMDGDLDHASAGRAIVLQLDTDIDVARGAVLTTPEARCSLSRQIEAQLVWLSDVPLDPTHGLLVRTATDLVPVGRIAVKASLDLETLEQHPATACGTNDIVVADIVLGRPAALDRFADHPETGSFVLVDALTGATVAGGVVKAGQNAGPGFGVEQSFRLTREILARGVCLGLDPNDPEFRRRAEEVAIILGAAGVSVEIE